MPRSLLTLRVDGRKIWGDTVVGEAYLIAPGSDPIPKDAISGCGSWYGGGGTYYCLRSEAGKTVLYKCLVDEGVTGELWERVLLW